jgi:hypothetical protein
VLDDQSGSEEVEVPVVVELPTTLDSTDASDVTFEMRVEAIANIAPSGGAAQTAIADAVQAGRISGFRVLNAAGVQVTGFELAAGARYRIDERAAPPSGLARAIEYYNPSFGHFFITANAAEIAALDAGTTVGWQRTGQSFNVYLASDSGRVGVCRFFGDFSPKSSHFYAPRGLGCEGALANPRWQWEGDVFFMPLPATDGTCPAGTVPVYRLYNNGMGGAPNHRFTTSESTWLDMLRDGYIAEGAGPGVGMCSPQ